MKTEEKSTYPVQSIGGLTPPHESNEITAIPELLDLLDLKGMIITIGTLVLPEKSVAKIAEKKADYVISLKGNQQSVHNGVKDFFDYLYNKDYCEKYKIQQHKYYL